MKIKHVNISISHVCMKSGNLWWCGLISWYFKFSKDFFLKWQSNTLHETLRLSQSALNVAGACWVMSEKLKSLKWNDFQEDQAFLGSPTHNWNNWNFQNYFTLSGWDTPEFYVFLKSATFWPKFPSWGYWPICTYIYMYDEEFEKRIFSVQDNFDEETDWQCRKGIK